MPATLSLLILATLLPLAGFVVLMLLGKRMGSPLAGVLAALMTGASFVATAAATIYWLNGGNFGGQPFGMHAGPIYLPIAFLPVGEGARQSIAGFLDFSLYVDSLTLLMFAAVSGIATVVQIFSIGYMRGDPHFARYFTYLCLFVSAMLAMLLSGTLLQILIFWELVGVCSYLLIGFWHDRPGARAAAMDAFIINRVGDVLFLIAIGVVFAFVGNLSLPAIWNTLGGVAAGSAGASSLMSTGVLTFVGIAFFIAAAGKSAQFPLHTWLPDAMTGPTPVSALIHAATMVAAGVYLLGRVYPILTPDARLFIAIIGVITLALGAVAAVVQTDIKRLLAYSTISQLGFMTFAIGVGSWGGAMFHLIAHAFCKALLFLSAGSVIHAMHHEQRLSEYGGLGRTMPFSTLGFLIGALALAGVPTLSASMSKEILLTHAAATSLLPLYESTAIYRVLIVVAIATSGLTAFYLARCWMLTFWHSPRNPPLYKNTTDRPIFWVPVMILIVASAIGGRWFGIAEMIDSAEGEMRIAAAVPTPGSWPITLPRIDTVLPGEAVDEAGTPLTASQQLQVAGHWRSHEWALIAMGIGLTLGIALYAAGPGVERRFRLRPRAASILAYIESGFGIDLLQRRVFVAIATAIARTCELFDRRVIDRGVNGVANGWKRLADHADWTDRVVVDGAVGGVAAMTNSLGDAVRTPQNGRVRVYVAVVLCTLAAAAAGVLVIVRG